MEKSKLATMTREELDSLKESVENQLAILDYRKMEEFKDELIKLWQTKDKLEIESLERMLNECSIHSWDVFFATVIDLFENRYY